MQTLKSILHFIDGTSDLMGRIFSYLMIALVGLVCADVFMRYVLNNSLFWAQEIVGFIFGTFMVWAGAYNVFHKQHVTVDILYSHWSVRTQAIVDLISSLLFFALVGVLCYYGGQIAITATIDKEIIPNTGWDPPLYPFRIMLFLAFFLLLLQGIVKFIRDMQIALTGKEATL